jgi:hypothetical protein
MTSRSRPRRLSDAAAQGTRMCHTVPYIWQISCCCRSWSLAFIDEPLPQFTRVTISFCALSR